jgi:Ca-activated chloride channel homolog
MYRLEHPNALYLLTALIFVMLLRWTYVRWKAARFKILADSHLLPHILKGYSKSKANAKFILALLISALIITSLANLQVGGKINNQARSETIDMILAVDISHSMLAEDVSPSRLERAKMICLKLAEEVKFAKTGIVLFAGDAYIHMPVTSDPGAVRMFISSIEPNLISMQGTAIGKAISISAEAFERTDAKNKAVILISDGENFEDDAIAAAQIAKDGNIVIHSIGVGTKDGAPIPIKENGKTIGFKKDNNNNTVISKPDFQLLSGIAAQSGGVSVDGNQPGKAVEMIYTELEKLDRAEGESIEFADWDSLFYLFAIPALILLILDFLIIERKMKWQEIFSSMLHFSLKPSKRNVS